LWKKKRSGGREEWKGKEKEGIKEKGKTFYINMI
jgi:hypothetical protein